MPDVHLTAHEAETLARLLEAVPSVARGRPFGYPFAFVDKDEVVTGLNAWVDRSSAT